MEKKAIHARVDFLQGDPLHDVFVETQKEYGLKSHSETLRHLIAEKGKGKMKAKILFERIQNLANLAEMKRAKAELEKSKQAGLFEAAHDAFNQVLAILKMEETNGN